MNKVKQLFSIEYPIIQGGMVWCSGWELASAVSNAGGLGLIGAGSMHPDTLQLHIQKCKNATSKPFGVNVPLLYPEIETIMNVIIREGVKIVFTSAGNPKTWVSTLQQEGIKVAHVVSNLKFAKKCEEAKVDAVVVEGTEAGGHNGREGLTTFCLIPLIRNHVSIPLIAAGGIASGRAMLGAMALGADGIQVGTRFAVSEESSAHVNFKNYVINSTEGDTDLVMKKLVPTRLLKNEFYKKIEMAESRGESTENIKLLLGKGRAKKGIFEGDIIEGELEIGQVAAYIDRVKPAASIIKEIWEEFATSKQQLLMEEI